MDACEEARILPDIKVEITKIEGKKDVIELTTEDNGPGIPQKSIEKVFGQLLFGSRFHAIRQSRGQQGNWDHWSCNVLAIDHGETNSSHLKNCE